MTELFKTKDGDTVEISDVDGVSPNGIKHLANITVLQLSDDTDDEAGAFFVRLAPEQNVRLAAALLERAAEHYKGKFDYGRVDAARGSLAAVIRDADEKAAHEAQVKQDEEELVQFVLDTTDLHEEQLAKNLLSCGRDKWVERKAAVEKKIRNKVLAEQGFNITAHNEMDSNCDYISHNGTRYSGMDWWAWSGIKDEAFPMKELRNYKTHPVVYKDGVDING